mmetsp:Transcript_6073/g.18510  ORF Transcript_6073/g.18510 Transcript_6073/m.18510 type:complete len:268 (-) Transcript_6073:1323-2126(-)
MVTRCKLVAEKYFSTMLERALEAEQLNIRWMLGPKRSGSQSTDFTSVNKFRPSRTMSSGAADLSGSPLASNRLQSRYRHFASVAIGSSRRRKVCRRCTTRRWKLLSSASSGEQVLKWTSTCGGDRARNQLARRADLPTPLSPWIRSGPQLPRCATKRSSSSKSALRRRYKPVKVRRKDAWLLCACSKGSFTTVFGKSLRICSPSCEITNCGSCSAFWYVVTRNLLLEISCFNLRVFSGSSPSPSSGGRPFRSRINMRARCDGSLIAP